MSTYLGLILPILKDKVRLSTQKEIYMEVHNQKRIYLNRLHHRLKVHQRLIPILKINLKILSKIQFKILQTNQIIKMEQ